MPVNQMVSLGLSPFSVIVTVKFLLHVFKFYLCWEGGIRKHISLEHLNKNRWVPSQFATVRKLNLRPEKLKEVAGSGGPAGVWVPQKNTGRNCSSTTTHPRKLKVFYLKRDPFFKREHSFLNQHFFRGIS